MLETLTEVQWNFAVIGICWATVTLVVIAIGAMLDKDK